MLKVSIIIPVYNLENEIARCLESCIKQSYTNIEIIVVNDGSTDASRDIIDSITENDTRIIHIYKENQGLPFARKTGMEKATGDYFFHLDGDDYIPENAIYSLISKTPNKEYDIVIGNYYQKLVNSNDVKKVRNNRICGNNPDLIASAMILGHISWSLCFKLIKKDFYLGADIRVPKISFGEDGIATLQMLSRNPKICFVDSYVYYYINRPTSMVNKIDPQTFNNRLDSYIYIRNIISQEFRLYKFILTAYDLKFHTINFHNIARAISDDERLLVLKIRTGSFYYRIQLHILLWLRRISLRLFNVALIKFPTAILLLQYCFIRKKS